MIKFYAFSCQGRILITLMLGLSVLVQTMALIFNFYSSKFNKKLILKNLLEVALLGEILVFALLHGQLISGYRAGFLVETSYEWVRILLFIVILLVVILLCIFNNDLWALTVIPFSLVTLPITENFLGSLFPYFYLAGLLFFLIRATKICLSAFIKIKTNISALSAVRAIDILDTGILFSENDGYILLSNEKMRYIMLATRGRLFRNAIQFYDAVVSSQDDPRYTLRELDGQMICILPDGRAWMFVKSDILLRMKNYIHISVTDVTKVWDLTRQLQHQEEALREKRQQLKETMANLHILSKKKEIEYGKIRAHDILGQGLTVLLRIIQNKDYIDYDLLTSLSKGLLEQLQEDDGIKPEEELKGIQDIFARVGVDIKFQGQFPNHPDQSRLFIDIIREGSTNAVRHGLATEISIKLGPIDDSYQLSISNNGYTSKKPIVFGSGIKAMKKKVSHYGGSLDFVQEPLFTLLVVIPGGDEYV